MPDFMQILDLLVRDLLGLCLFTLVINKSRSQFLSEVTGDQVILTVLGEKRKFFCKLHKRLLSFVFKKGMDKVRHTMKLTTANTACVVTHLAHKNKKPGLAGPCIDTSLAHG